MNIYEKMLAIMKDVKYLSKDDNVSFGNTNYMALSEEKVTALMRQKLIEQKLVVYPIRQESSRTGQITHVDVVYRLVNVEAPEEYIDIASCGDGADSQDKGAGKAMTYSYKYMWLRAFAIPTGEDPDKIASEELDDQAKRKQVLCPICGDPMQEITVKGSAVSPQEQLKNMGCCPACYRKQGKKP